jgi:hypothetical protein
MSDSVILELEVPFGQVAAEDILSGATLHQQALSRAAALRPFVSRWEFPSGVAPRISLTHSRDLDSAERCWRAEWRETPVGFWLSGLEHGLVAASIPFISHAGGTTHKWRDWLVVNRKEVAAALNLLSPVLSVQRGEITVIGGRSVALPETSAGWESLGLDDRIRQLIQRDLEFFLGSGVFFRDLNIPRRRGYLLYGPPGNGKTSVVRAIAGNPMIRPFRFDFSNERLFNDSMTDLFELAAEEARWMLQLSCTAKKVSLANLAALGF